jgi:hypothetical protein
MPEGIVIVATFAEDGRANCSGPLEDKVTQQHAVQRWDFLRPVPKA